ncbi:MAG: hypothetical protein RLZZ622_1753, partial [Planctomycetota bacterium]
GTDCFNHLRTGLIAFRANEQMYFIRCQTLLKQAQPRAPATRTQSIL